jgi:hypothetical protein
MTGDRGSPVGNPFTNAFLMARHQQIRAAVAQVHRKEECSARNPIAAIIQHTGSMPELPERRNALPRGLKAFPPYALSVLHLTRDASYFCLSASSIAAMRSGSAARGGMPARSTCNSWPTVLLRVPQPRFIASVNSS